MIVKQATVCFKHRGRMKRFLIREGYRKLEQATCQHTTDFPIHCNWDDKIIPLGRFFTIYYYDHKCCSCK